MTTVLMMVVVTGTPSITLVGLVTVVVVDGLLAY